jgi:release factor glutamine methyltransferase
MKENFKKFLNCKIDLRKKVFIPRIETEFWVKKAIKDCKLQILILKLKKPKFLDVFSGSGCIGISILKNIKNSFVDFVDVDKNAIDQIKINLKLNKISPKRYKIIQSDLFKNLKNKKYDFIFANPPYVAIEKIKEVQISVLKYEPKISFLAGKGGLRYIKKFLKNAKNYLRKGGKIFMEFDPFQKKEIEKILKREVYNNFKFLKDQFGKYRLLVIKI